MSIRRSNLKYVQYVEPILGPEPHELTLSYSPSPTSYRQCCRSDFTIFLLALLLEQSAVIYY
jgi:hypothetical protein